MGSEFVIASQFLCTSKSVDLYAGNNKSLVKREKKNKDTETAVSDERVAEVILMMICRYVCCQGL
jgi:hypothetical protein